ncbi:MAG: hypothetical protein QM796_12540 [Chthoniobacteraceae bacterium]
MTTIEPLEARIAPATLTGRVLTYTDTDGDQVTVKFSKGTLSESDFTFDTAFNSTGGQQLQQIALGGSQTFQGANITVSVVKDGGDGFVNLGLIYASGIDLGKVTIHGDLSRIIVGDSNVKTAGLKSLAVNSFGVAGTTTQGSSTDTESDITGKLGSLKVATDFSNMQLYVVGGQGKAAKYGSVGSVYIGGSLIGGTSEASAYFECTGSLGKLTVVGDLTGDDGEASGKITVDQNLGSAVIGSITGGGGNDSGKLRVYGGAGKITVNGDITGGDVASPASDGAEAGIIEVDKTVASVVIKGNIEGKNSYYSGLELHGNVGSISVGTVEGGAAQDDGSIVVGGKAGKITITGGLVGGDSDDAGSVIVTGGIGKITVGAYSMGGDGYLSGSVSTTGAIGSFSMGGYMLGGAGELSGSIVAGKNIKSILLGGITGDVGDSSGSIASLGGSIKTIHITGDVTTSTDSGAGTAGYISAGGSLGSVTIDGNVSGGTGGFYNIAGVKGIGSVKVGKDFTKAQILAGYTATSPVQNASIGSVTIGGNFVGGNIIAGVSAGADSTFGTGDDAVISTGNPLSKIASIIITGTADGSGTSGEHFGIEASQIKLLVVNGINQNMTKGPHNDAFLLGNTGELVVTEFPPI